VYYIITGEQQKRRISLKWLWIESDQVHTKRSSKFEILSSCTKLFCSWSHLLYSYRA